MARPSQENVRGIGDISTLFRWDLDVAIPTGSAINLSSIGVAVNDLNWRCQTTELPKMTGQSINVEIRGHRTRRPGIYEYSNTINLAFVETVTNPVNKFIRHWRELCWEAKTGKTRGINELTLDLVLYRLDNMDRRIWKYVLHSCFYETHEAPQLEAYTSDAFKPGLTVSYDYYEDRAIDQT